MTTLEFNIYDKVWIMQHNRPKEKIVVAKTESISYKGSEVTFEYLLVNKVSRVIIGNNEGIHRPTNMIYRTRKEILDKLV